MRDHRSLVAWSEARRVTTIALGVSRTQWKPWAAWVFRQLQRSALSIQLNIAEGHALGDRGRFANHLAIAYGSATETTELFQVGLEENIFEEDVALEGIAHSRSCERLLLGLLKKYRTRPER